MKNKKSANQVKTVYPCRWLYKAIGPDREKLEEALRKAAGSRSCTVSFSKKSSRGKYHCFNLEVSVADEEERNAIYRAIKSHPHVTMVL